MLVPNHLSSTTELSDHSMVSNSQGSRRCSKERLGVWPAAGRSEEWRVGWQRRSPARGWLAGRQELCPAAWHPPLAHSDLHMSPDELERHVHIIEGELLAPREQQHCVTHMTGITLLFTIFFVGFWTCHCYSFSIHYYAYILRSEQNAENLHTSVRLSLRSNQTWNMNRDDVTDTNMAETSYRERVRKHILTNGRGLAESATQLLLPGSTQCSHIRTYKLPH